ACCGWALQRGHTTTAGRSTRPMPRSTNWRRSATSAPWPRPSAPERRANATWARLPTGWRRRAAPRAPYGLASTRRARDALRSSGDDAVWALAILGDTLIDSPVPVPEAEGILSELMDEFGVRPTFRFELLRWQAALAQLGGDDDRAWRLLDTARGLDRDLGRRTGLYLTRTEALMLRRAGRYAELRGRLLPYIAELERLERPEAPVARSALVELEVRLGNLDAARAAAAGLEGAD